MSILKSSKQFVVSILIFVVLSILMCSSISATDEPEIIRVGYVANYGVVNTSFAEGSEGYGYEYLNHIINYMDGDYSLDFIPCTSWEDAKNSLNNDEIDILGFTTNTADPSLIYTQNDFGQSTAMLARVSDVSLHYDGLSSLEGQTIAVPDYYSDYSILYEFLEDEGIQANVVSVPCLYLSIYMGTHDIDYVFMGSMQSHGNLTIITSLESKPIHFASIEANQTLIDELDCALALCKEAESHLEAQLKLTYSSYNYTTNAYISDENYEMLQEKGTYTVGIRNFSSPLVYTTDEGFAGTAFLLMDMLSKSAGIELDYVLLDSNSSDEDFAKADFLIAATTATSDLGFPYISSSWLSLPYVLVEQRSAVTDGASSQTIGVPNYYQIADSVMQESFGDKEIITYPTITDLQAAYDSGEIDGMIITSVTLNLIRSDLVSTDYIITDMNNSAGLSLAFSEDLSIDEITVFNKLLANLDQSSLEELAMSYALASPEVTLWTLARDNPWIVFNAFVVLLLVAAVVAILSEYRRRVSLAHRLDIDELTGLATQQKLIRHGKALLKEHPNTHYTLVSIDIDNFKYINEMYGYDVGSQLLVVVAKYIKSKVGNQTLLARCSADHFLLMAPTQASQDTLRQWKYFSSTLQETIETQLGLSCRVNFSIGIYAITNPELDFSVMIDYANIARNQGKDTIGFTFHHFTEEMGRNRAISNEITTAMVPAIENEEFILYYQPKLDMTTEQLNGAEVLVRWQRYDNMTPPNQFIPLFEKNGFIETLDYYVLSHACKFLQDNKDANIPKLSVNLSSITLLSDSVVQKIMNILEQHEIATSQIDLEITETAFVEDSATIKQVCALRKNGFTISMDDFGTGVSSLNRLKNIELDTLKIDREFIIDALENERGNMILQYVVDMSKALNLETVAEGIETELQRDFLKKIGVDVGQGYLYARPMSEEDFLKYCKR